VHQAQWWRPSRALSRLCALGTHGNPRRALTVESGTGRLRSARKGFWIQLRVFLGYYSAWDVEQYGLARRRSTEEFWKWWCGWWPWVALGGVLTANTANSGTTTRGPVTLLRRLSVTLVAHGGSLIRGQVGLGDELLPWNWPVFARQTLHGGMGCTSVRAVRTKLAAVPTSPLRLHHYRLLTAASSSRLVHWPHVVLLLLALAFASHS